ncbi:MAG: NAD/NADP octopine/nopaline dehydrogenase family protein [Lachnospiraceae bacterium]|nr:NAD/NADP octopine/nopaline dehydrogenase family protein [Lachnospiraceae bacterium]
MKDYRYVIIGAGNGGQSLAGDMVLRGTKVSAIYDKNPAPIRDIAANGGIRMSGPVIQGLAPIEHPTESLEDAMQQGNVFLVTIVGNFHPQLAKEMAPYIRESDIVLLIPGNAGSSLLFRRALIESGVKDLPLIGETLSMPYATRLLGPAHAGIKARKNTLPMAALPARRNEELFAAINPAIPETSLWSDALSVGMNNINPAGHVPFYLFNIGKVEAPRPEDSDFHAWNTKTTDRIADLYDAERMAVMEKIGLTPLSHREAAKICYNNVHYVPIAQEKIVSENAVQVPDRFIDEDVPLNMILVSEMGHALGIPTPVTDLLIDVANLVRERDFRKTGTTMARLGITSLEKDAIAELVGA